MPFFPLFFFFYSFVLFFRLPNYEGEEESRLIRGLNEGHRVACNACFMNLNKRENKPLSSARDSPLESVFVLPRGNYTLFDRICPS